MRIQLFASFFGMALIVSAATADEVAEGNISASEDHFSNGNGTVTYRVTLRNVGEKQICCFVFLEAMNTIYQVVRDRRQVCVFGGREEWTGIPNVTQGLGAIRRFDGSVEEMDIQMFDNRFEIESCRYLEDPFSQ